jgi:hypothetical protein
VAPQINAQLVAQLSDHKNVKTFSYRVLPAIAHALLRISPGGSSQVGFIVDAGLERLTGIQHRSGRFIPLEPKPPLFQHFQCSSLVFKAVGTSSAAFRTNDDVDC